MKGLLAILGLALINNLTYANNESFIISRHQNSSSLDACALAVSNAYKALNIKFSIVEYPGRRSLYMANSGQTDAELCRIKKTEEAFKQLIRIEPAIHQLSFHAITRASNEHFNKASDIEGLKIGSLRGMLAAELIFPNENVRYEKNIEQVIGILKNKTVDVVVLPMLDIKLLVEKGQLNGLFIHPAPLYQLELFHFVHMKHQGLVSALRQVFSQQVSPKQDN